ncbi:MAG TPA: TylF/MycF family methyltransferase [Gammaproteobacteria bacterium]|nr:TylF/MycF family methyltransferase [Gammaproteobacteria bacterium]
MTDDARALYIDLVKKSLTCSLYEGYDGSIYKPRRGWRRALVRKLLPDDVRLMRQVPEENRAEGRDWPSLALTMIGAKRLDNLQQCVETVLEDGVPGDFIETGIWRGGAVILMRAILKAHGVTDRIVYGADSFEGLPKPDAENYPADTGDRHWTFDQLAVSLEQVTANVARYGLLDHQVRFLKGWFKDTLPSAPIERLAVARLDGDMYESTIEALEVLYPKLEPGGFLIVDDYGAVEGCKRAIEDYRRRAAITEPMTAIDWAGVYWRKR